MTLPYILRRSRTNLLLSNFCCFQHWLFCRVFEAEYAALGALSLPPIATMTGCLAPCHFMEYKLAGAPVLMVRPAVVTDPL